MTDDLGPWQRAIDSIVHRPPLPQQYWDGMERVLAVRLLAAEHRWRVWIEPHGLNPALWVVKRIDRSGLDIYFTLDEAVRGAIVGHRPSAG